MQSLRRAIPGSRTVPQKEEEAAPGHVTACARPSGVRHTVRIVPPRVRAGQGKSAKGGPRRVKPAAELGSGSQWRPE